MILHKSLVARESCRDAAQASGSRGRPEGYCTGRPEGYCTSHRWQETNTVMVHASKTDGKKKHRDDAQVTAELATGKSHNDSSIRGTVYTISIM